jgi:DNA-binding PadR family transcriptional regulator
VKGGTWELGRPDYVVLGMIRLGARSGYEIKQAVELSIRFFWTISHAQIYPSLERLEAAELVEGCSEPLGKRQRRTFEITEAGETALREWLQRDEPMPFELRDIGMVKLFFADALNSDEALSLVNSIKRRSEDQVATLRSIEPAAKLSADEGNALPGLTLRMGIAFHQAMIDVCQDFEHEVADS